MNVFVLSHEADWCTWSTQRPHRVELNEMGVVA
jgi:hypothetical protein